MPVGMDRAQCLLFCFIAVLIILGIVALFGRWLSF
jgi:hypothetical protein